MSEFSRQAHPDAAQRERLSRDISGLNPRQVQVWFQNRYILLSHTLHGLVALLITFHRRAKLKRLTTDDQERMRRSRALPEGFDFSQTLELTFREERPQYGSPLTEPMKVGGGMTQRPSLRLGTVPMKMASNSMGSIFTNNALRTVSATGSANPSPISPVNEGSERSGTFPSATQSPLVTSPQFTNPFGRSYSLSAGSSAYQRQARPSSQNSIMGLGGQHVATTSPSYLSNVNNTYGYGNLPPLQFTKIPFQTRDGQHFGRFETTGGLSHGSGIAMNQHYHSPLSSPNTLSYDHSQTLYPSGSGYRAPSYYQSPDTNTWQGSQMSPQGYQYAQNLQPHQTAQQQVGSQSSQVPLSQDPSVNRHDQRSYSHSGEQYSRMSAQSDSQHLPTFLGEEAATSPIRQPLPDAARPRARSDTCPAYYSAQS